MIRKKVKCPFCEYECCTACSQRYLLGTSENAHCMNCRKAWSRLFLTKAFTKVFVNVAYKTSRENVLFEIEKSMMVDTMPHVEYKKKCKQNLLKISENIENYQELLKTLHMMYTVTLDDKIAECNLKREMNEICLENEILLFENGVRKIVKDTTRKFIKPCPRNACNGFLSSQWKCRLCDLFTCSKCHDPKDSDDHTCLESSLQTVELLKNDTHPCPNCGVSIFKIGGCDQMYCTECHTAFSWRTGKVEFGKIHNPHYYEFQRGRGGAAREIGDVQCGGLPDLRVICDILRNFQTQVTIGPMLSTLARSIFEFEQYELLQYVNRVTVLFDMNREERINFIMGNMSEALFKNHIYRVDKGNNKMNEIGMVATTLVQIMSDLFQRLVSTKSVNDIYQVHEEIIEASKYINDLFYDISTAYECTVYRISISTGAISRFDKKKLDAEIRREAVLTSV